MKKLNLILVTLIIYFLQVDAQQFLTPTNAFSHKKTAYVTLKNGEEIKGTISKVKRKKGMIEGVDIVNGSGKTIKLTAKDINYMYLPPSGLDKIQKASDFLTSAAKWNNEKLNQDFLNQGYAYIEQTEVKIKKKTHSLLMQVLNPESNKYVTVYNDPYAEETGVSFGVNGVSSPKLGGGIDKSYYIKFNNESTAFKMSKGDYKKEFMMFWTSCKELIKKNSKPQWKDFPKHIIQYNETCGEENQEE